MKKIALITMIMTALLPNLCVAGEKKLTQRELTKQERIIIVKAVTEGFKDPESARFKWVKGNLFWGNDKSSYCGLVNGKNSYGAYIGYEIFYIDAVFERGKIKQARATLGEDAQGFCLATMYYDLSSAK